MPPPHTRHPIRPFTFNVQQGARHAGLDIAGKDAANPTGILLSSVQMLRYLKLPNFADRMERAIFTCVTWRGAGGMWLRGGELTEGALRGWRAGADTGGGGAGSRGCHRLRAPSCPPPLPTDPLASRCSTLESGTKTRDVGGSSTTTQVRS